MEKSNIIKKFLDGLKARLSVDDKRSLSYATGASAEQLAQLKKFYPGCPQSLLELLSHINGTYWQRYGEHEITVLMLGSDVFQYPYYLRSVEQILKRNKYSSSINEIYGDYIDDALELLDEAIDPDINNDAWLCFSHCMNNGGTSRLYIDFNPTNAGKQGQIIRYLHDPDSYKVIAGSFDEYLQTLIDHDYAFLLKEE